MNWNTRIREAFETAGRRVDDAVLDELADHAADLEAELQRQQVEPVALQREVDRQIGVWVYDLVAAAGAASGPGSIRWSSSSAGSP